MKRKKEVVVLMNFVLCDDNPVYLEILYRNLEDYCAKKDWLCTCTRYQSPSDLLAADLSSVQVIFLDIDMPEMNGLRVARQLRTRYDELLIVFVTNFIEYAPEGYTVDAFRYLLKGNIGSQLPSCLDDIWKKLYVNQESIRVHSIDGFIPVTLKDILYIEGTPQRHVLLHRNKPMPGTIECIGNLSDFESTLEGKGFLRIQKSFLANIYHIHDIRNYTAFLDNQEKLSVSRSNYAKICEQYLLWETQG
jgi:DNA-binding LytR/AlgR family response regulator